MKRKEEKQGQKKASFKIKADCKDVDKIPFSCHFTSCLMKRISPLNKEKNLKEKYKHCFDNQPAKLKTKTQASVFHPDTVLILAR